MVEWFLLKFSLELLGSSFYYTANRVSLRLFEVFSLWILVKLLPKEDIALIGITVGFISVLNLLNISPYRRIFKSFADIDKRFNDHVSSYIAFWLLQSSAMLALAVIAAMFYASLGFAGGMFVVLVGLVVSYLLGNLQLLFQEIFFVKLRQKAATYFNAASMLLFLLSLGYLFFYPTLENYVALIILKSALTAAGFFLLAKKEIGFVFSLPGDWKRIVKDALTQFALYDHLIGVCIDLTGKVFLFILGFFALQSIVGDYTIALSLANFLTFFPLIVYRIAMLALTRVSTKDGMQKVLTAFTKYSAVFSAAQFTVFVFFLAPLVDFFTSGKPGNVYNYGLLLGLGATIFNAGLPVHAMAVLKSSISKYFWLVVLPVTGLSIAAYFAIAAIRADPILIAVVYVIAAISVNALAYLHVKRNVDVSIQKIFVFPEEKEAIVFLLRKMGLAGKNAKTENEI